jgi:hypothetical protein
LIRSLRDKKKYTPYLNTVVLSRRPGEFKVIDLAELKADEMKTLVFRSGVALVEPLNGYTFQVYKSIGLPMVIMFVDKDDIKTQDYLYTFEKVAEIFEDSVKFVWMNGNDPSVKFRMKSLGLIDDKLPAIAFNLLEARQLSFDQRLPVNRDNIHTFVQSYVEGKRDSLNSKAPQNSEMENLYTNTPQVTAAEFEFKVLAEGLDVCVLFYSSVDSKESLTMAPYFNKLAQRFAELEFPNIRIYRYDAGVQATPKHIRSDSLPAVYFFPAFHKKPAFPVYSGQAKTLPMMFFIANHADIETELPELPHLSPDQVEEYYRQKEQLSPDRQKAVAEANERRHWEL